MPSPPTIHPNSLIPLHDGRPGLRRGLHAEIREPAAAELARASVPQPSTPQPSTSPILDFIASSEALDRYGEIISAGGWRLENYRRNPVFQNAHQYGDVIFTLGKALITEVRGDRLFQRIEFATDVNPMARIAYGLYKGKFLNAVSVGFIPLKWEDAPATSGPSTLNSPTLNSPACRRRYLEQELLEVSAVGIPANPEALQLGLQAGAIEKADLKDLLELVRLACEGLADSPSPQPSPSGRGRTATALPSLLQPSNTPPLHPSKTPPLQLSKTPIPKFCGNPAAPTTHAGAPGARSHEAQLLQLARALRDALRA
jgi:hypothetical protein